MVKYIQNLDKVLSDLERAKVTIFGAKSQFCRADIKIVGYNYDANGRHMEILKVLKILHRPKYTDMISVGAFLGACIYYQIWIKNVAQFASLICHQFKKNTSFV